MRKGVISMAAKRFAPKHHIVPATEIANGKRSAITGEYKKRANVDGWGHQQPSTKPVSLPKLKFMEDE